MENKEKKSSSRVDLEKTQKILAIIISIGTIIGGIITFFGWQNNKTITSPPSSSSKSENNKSLEIANTPAPQNEVQEYRTVDVNQYVSRHNKQVQFGITTVDLKDDILTVNFYVDNNSNEAVTVATMNNLVLVDANRKQYTPMNNLYFTTSPKAREDCKIQFELPKPNGSFTLKSDYFIMKDYNREIISIPFEIK